MNQNSIQGAGLADLLQQAQANQPVQMHADNHQVQQQPQVAPTASALPGLPGGVPVVQVASVAQATIPSGAIEIELSEPVQVKGGQLVDTVYLRPPTMGDWLDCGDLMQALAVEGEGGIPKVDIRVDPQAAVKWFSKLSGQNIRYFRAMCLKDWRYIMTHLQEVAGDAGGENPMM